MRRFICPKCNKRTRPTTHHILPKRWFGTENNNETIELCRKCHSALEVIIHRSESGWSLAPQRYRQILYDFLKVY